MAEYVTERLIEEIASNLGIKTTQVNATLELLEEGGTIPFIKIPDMHDCVYPIITESTLTEAGAKTQTNNKSPTVWQD